MKQEDFNKWAVDKITALEKEVRKLKLNHQHLQEQNYKQLRRVTDRNKQLMSHKLAIKELKTVLYELKNRHYDG